MLAKAVNYYTGTALFTKEQVFANCFGYKNLSEPPPLAQFSAEDVQRLKYILQGDAYFDLNGLIGLCLSSEYRWKLLCEAGLAKNKMVGLAAALCNAEYLVPIAIQNGGDFVSFDINL